MNEIYPSGSILTFSFSGTTKLPQDEYFIDIEEKTNIPIHHKNGKKYIKLNKLITKNDFFDNFLFIQINQKYITKYKLQN